MAVFVMKSKIMIMIQKIIPINEKFEYERVISFNVEFIINSVKMIKN